MTIINLGEFNADDLISDTPNSFTLVTPEQPEFSIGSVVELELIRKHHTTEEILDHTTRRYKITACCKVDAGVEITFTLAESVKLKG